MALKKITLSDRDLTAIRYAVDQAMYRLEASIDAQKLYNKLSPSSSRSDLITALDDLLLDLECVHSELFEGGEADET